MRKHVFLYGLLGGVLIAGLKFIEYRWLIVEHSIEIYGGLVAALFAGLGVWLGLRLTRHKETIIVREVEVPAPLNFERNERKLESLSITPRELEILTLIAEGLATSKLPRACSSAKTRSRPIRAGYSTSLLYNGGHRPCNWRSNFD